MGLAAALSSLTALDEDEDETIDYNDEDESSGEEASFGADDLLSEEDIYGNEGDEDDEIYKYDFGTDDLHSAEDDESDEGDEGDEGDEEPPELKLQSRHKKQRTN